MMEDSKKINYILIILIFLLGCYGAVENYRVLREDTTPFIYDILNSYVKSIEHYNFFVQGKIVEGIKFYINNYVVDYGPLYLFQAFPFYMIMGVSEDVAAFSNVIHLFILLFSTYFVGKKLKNSYAGFLSAIIIFFIPGTLPYSRAYLPAFGLVAFIMLSLAFFLYSDFFKNRKYSILFGISVGLGMLIKYSFFLYLSVIVLVLSLRYLRHKKTNFLLNRKQKKNLVISVMISLIIMLLWYPQNLYSIFGFFTRKAFYDSFVVFQDFNLIDKWAFVIFKYKIFIKYFLDDFTHSALFVSGFFILKRLIFPEKIRKKRLMTEYDFIIIGGIIFLVLLNSPASARYVLFLMPFSSILLGIFIFDSFMYFVNLLTNRNSVKLLAFILLIILLSGSLVSYLDMWTARTNPARTADDIFAYGLMAPKEHHNKHKEVFNVINKTSKGRNVPILSLQASEVMAILYGSKHLTNFKYDYEFPIFCLPLPDFTDPWESCFIPQNITCNYFLRKGIVIDSDIRKSSKFDGAWGTFPERGVIRDNIFEVWGTCKDNFVLAETIEDVPVLTNNTHLTYTNSTLYIYVKENASS